MIPLSFHRAAFGRRCILCASMLLVPSCRETEPPPTHFQDLGDGGVALLPTASTWHNPAIADGTAEWQPFRPVDPDEQGDGGGNAGNAPSTATAASSETEVDIREMVDEYNDMVAEGAAEEDILEFFTEPQRPKLKQVRDAVSAFRGKLSELRAALVQQSPEGGQAVDQLLEQMAALQKLPLTVDSITVESETAASGKLSAAEAGLSLPGMSTDVRFVYADEYWFIDLPAIETLAGMVPMMQGALPQFDALIQGIQGGQLSADAVIQQLNTLAQSTVAVAPADGEQGAAEAAGDPGDEDENDG